MNTSGTSSGLEVCMDVDDINSRSQQQQQSKKSSSTTTIIKTGNNSYSNAVNPEIFNSVVKIFVVKCSPNYSRPWQMLSQSHSSSTGFMIHNKRILCTAHGVRYARSIRVRKHGQAKKWEAKIEYIAHECDLAILRVPEQLSEQKNSQKKKNKNRHKNQQQNQKNQNRNAKKSSTTGKKNASNKKTTAPDCASDPASAVIPASLPSTAAVAAQASDALSIPAPVMENDSKNGGSIVASAASSALSSLDSSPAGTPFATTSAADDNDVKEDEQIPDSPEFWLDYKPLILDDEQPKLQETVVVAGYPIGGDNICVTKGVISRLGMTTYSHSYTSLFCVQIDAAINHGNGGGPTIKNNKVVGVALYSAGHQNIGYCIPIKVVNHLFEDIAKNGKYTGIPRGGFAYQNTESPSLKDYKQMSPNVNIQQNNSRYIYMSIIM